MLRVTAFDWMREDALLLREHKRQQGCLALLLCMVDALAAHWRPGKHDNKKRYCEYLSECLTLLGRNAAYRVEKLDRCVDLAEIIYTYFRCSLVHEGDSRDDEGLEVQLKYTSNQKSIFGAGILIDRNSQTIEVQAEWLTKLLLAVSEVNLGAKPDAQLSHPPNPNK